ncbi:hypothetical protein [Psychrobacillus sp. FSL H8-0510]|uniref:hypothetical protein n=1 Tax=Psychrobacillus sp. FSL H8-0510 TaxID=2921394 RepID=UPI0030FCD34E
MQLIGWYEFGFLPAHARQFLFNPFIVVKSPDLTKLEEAYEMVGTVGWILIVESVLFYVVPIRIIGVFG